MRRIVELDAGGGTRTPDTRIMIPANFGLAIGNFVAVGHTVGHNRTVARHLIPRVRRAPSGSIGRSGE